MAAFTSLEFKQNGPQILKTDANKIALVKNVAKADSFATMLGKIVAGTDFAAADVSFAANGQDLRATFAAKSSIPVTAGAADTDDLSVVVYSTTTSKVHLCQNATDRVITSNAGDKTDIPSFTYDVKEPT
jgi:hypothetical protein